MMNKESVKGLTTVASVLGPKERVVRLVNEIVSKGLTVFARVDHAAGAAEVGLTLRPTEVILFGNAHGGTPLMQASQTAGIDLPLKALVWQTLRAKPGFRMTSQAGSLSAIISKSAQINSPP
jgi:uncharacterized protein (DUF302 family)